MAQVEVKVKLDLPPGVELLGYRRLGDGHGFEVKFPLPDSCRCEKCGHEEPSTYEYKNTVYVVRHLDLWGQMDFSKFWTTHDNWKTGILNYFDGRYTSAAVEGINNKARVITKRCYGVKSAGALWNRLLLDLNRASEAAGRTIAELRGIVSGLKAVFLAFCT